MNAAQAKQAWRDGIFAEFDAYVKQELHCVNNTITQADVDVLIDFNYWRMNKPERSTRAIIQEIMDGPSD
jgi:hypothetical protein